MINQGNQGSMSKKHVVIFEPNTADQCGMLTVFKGLHHDVRLLTERKEIIRYIQDKHCDLVIIGADDSLTFSMELLKEIKRFCPNIPVILAASGANTQDAVTAIKSGATDFFLKPIDTEMMENFIWSVEKTQEPPSPQTSFEPFRIITQNSGMEHLMRVVKKVANSRASVLIQGNSGTGKELFARYIHGCSHRRENSFVAINCAALPETLLESELFGHEKGTFTGALAQKKGKFELAHGGTLLLDEISEMAYGLQAKLLRVLQERVIDRLGGVTPIPLDVRIIATTNGDLNKMICTGSFREDLYYRLNVIPFHLPPLKERMDDVPLLAAYFLKKYNQIDGKDVKGLTQSSLDLLMNRSWPGNVRELENVIERAVLMCEGDHLVVEDFSMAAAQRYGGYSSDPFMSGGSLKEMEKNVIFQTLDHTNDNRTHAAKILGISVRTLRNKLNEYKEKMENQ